MRPAWGDAGGVFRRAVPRNRRLDAAVYAEAGRPVFVTVRAAGTSAPFVVGDLCAAVVKELLAQRHACGCSIVAYCLMPDHMHLLAAPARDGASLIEFVRRFKSATTRAAWQHGWRGRLWQPRFYDRVLRADEAIAAVVAYILANPVRRGLAPAPAAYPWSALVDPPSV